MGKELFVMLMENTKHLNTGVIQRHVEHLKQLDKSNKLVVCGPFSDYNGGMVIIKTHSYEEADEICKTDPYISEGYKTYNLRTLQVADKNNGYLLG